MASDTKSGEMVSGLNYKTPSWCRRLGGCGNEPHVGISSVVNVVTNSLTVEGTHRGVFPIQL